MRSCGPGSPQLNREVVLLLCFTEGAHLRPLLVGRGDADGERRMISGCSTQGRVGRRRAQGAGKWQLSPSSGKLFLMQSECNPPMRLPGSDTQEMFYG